MKIELQKRCKQQEKDQQAERMKIDARSRAEERGAAAGGGGGRTSDDRDDRERGRKAKMKSRR